MVTISETFVPLGVRVPAAGSWLRIVPGAAVVLKPLVAVEVSDAAVSVLCPAVCDNPTTFGTVVFAKTMPGAATVVSRNFRSSMFRSVSVPSNPTLPGTAPPAGLTCWTVTVPAARFLVIEYSAMFPWNFAVSQFFGAGSPQSAGSAGGVSIVRTIVMFPGFSRCGSDNT